MPKHKYSDCSYCGGIVRAEKITVDFWSKGGELHLFEDVPAGVCRQCGEKYFMARVAKRIETSIQRNRCRRFIEIPVSSYSNLIPA